MSVWNTSTPAGSDLLSQGDDKIREMKTAIQDALRGDESEGVEAIFPGASPSTAPVYRYRGLKDTTANRPTAGQYGLFFDTTRNVLQRDNGTSWDDVGAVIPSGTKMVFYQASAPIGWTAVALNDKFLRVVTSGGTGGSTGGSGLSPSSTITLQHTHTSNGHTHTVPNHIHYFPYSTYSISGTSWNAGSYGASVDSDGDSGSYVTSASNPFGSTTLRGYTKPSTRTDGSSTTGTTIDTMSTELSSTAFQYADVVVASKD
jgi:hypothetical protein